MDRGQLRGAGLFMHRDMADASRAIRPEARTALLKRLASGLAHDMRTPLMVIRNAAYFLRRCGPPTPDTAESLDMIEAGVHELNEQLTALVDVTQTWEPDLKDTELLPMLEEIRSRAGGGNITWRFDLGDPPFVIRCDPVRFGKMLHELVRNARLALRGRGEIVIRARHQGAATIVDVRDNGPGVAEEIKDDIFEPFVSTKTAGLGLGLTICRHSAERHGGSIVLAESGSSGTVFRISLPRS